MQNPPSGKIVAQLHYASRCPASWRGELMGKILLRICSRRIAKSWPLRDSRARISPELRNFPAYGTNGAGSDRYPMRNLSLVYVLVCTLGVPATSARLRQPDQGQAPDRPQKVKKASRTGVTTAPKPAETPADKPFEKKADYSQEAF